MLHAHRSTDNDNRPILRRSAARAFVAPRFTLATGSLLLGFYQTSCLPSNLLNLNETANTQVAGATVEAAPLAGLNGQTVSVDQLQQALAESDGKSVVVVFVSPIPGPTGDAGATGPAGNSGPMGATGATGAVGPTGADGAVGPSGATGPAGPMGATGATGAAGAAGAVGAAGPAGPAGGFITGEIRMWAGPAAQIPSGWVLCDGAAVSRTAYAPLFAVLGTQYGPGDGSTTFNVPDFRDRVAMGATGEIGGVPSSTVLGAAATNGGSASHALTVNELPAHHHDMTHTHDTPGSSLGGLGSLTGVLTVPNILAVSPLTTSAPTPTDTGDTGGSQAFSTVSPFFAAYYIVYTGT